MGNDVPICPGLIFGVRIMSFVGILNIIETVMNDNGGSMCCFASVEFRGVSQCNEIRRDDELC